MSIINKLFDRMEHVGGKLIVKAKTYRILPRQLYTFYILIAA